MSACLGLDAAVVPEGGDRGRRSTAAPVVLPPEGTAADGGIACCCCCSCCCRAAPIPVVELLEGLAADVDNDVAEEDIAVVSIRSSLLLLFLDDGLLCGAPAVRLTPTSVTFMVNGPPIANTCTVVYLYEPQEQELSRV